jgi:RNA polymerase sigma factor (sigma-70 family)
MPQQIDPPLKDVRVEVRVRNNLILSRMEHRGIKSVAELARKMGIESQKGMLGDLVNMTKAAKNESGTWHILALDLADFFECKPEELFSEFQQEIALEKNRSEAEMTYAEMQRLASRRQEPVTPELEYAAKQLRSAIDQALQMLTPREERVIRLRFGFDGGEGLTLDQVGELFGRSRERIRNIEARALRKLKHPSRCKGIFAAATFAGKAKQPWSGEIVDAEFFDDAVLDAL